MIGRFVLQAKKETNKQIYIERERKGTNRYYRSVPRRVAATHSVGCVYMEHSAPVRPHTKQKRHRVPMQRCRGCFCGRPVPAPGAAGTKRASNSHTCRARHAPRKQRRHSTARKPTARQRRGTASQKPQPSHTYMRDHAHDPATAAALKRKGKREGTTMGTEDKSGSRPVHAAGEKPQLRINT